ncbi:MAG: hypothetical protein ACFKPT_31925 [Gloeotrichia echinulata GP01]
MNYLSDTISQMLWHLPVDASFLAQQIKDPDVLGQIQHFWNQFLQTGQAWALLIGLVIGYMIRNLTTYG